MKVSTENDNNFGYEKITVLVNKQWNYRTSFLNKQWNYRTSFLNKQWKN